MNGIKPIKNFNGYFISSKGVVYSNVPRGAREDLNKEYKTPLKEIKGRVSKNGYLRVYMRNTITGKRVDKFIHRLVAKAFIHNTFNKKIVHHKDGNRKNNSIDNLEWVTYKENNQDTINRGKVYRCEKTGRFIKASD